MTPQPCGNLDLVFTLFIKCWLFHMPCSRDVKSVSCTLSSSELAASFSISAFLKCSLILFGQAAPGAYRLQSLYFLKLLFCFLEVKTQWSAYQLIWSFDSSKEVKAWLQNRTHLLNNFSTPAHQKAWRKIYPCKKIFIKLPFCKIT